MQLRLLKLFPLTVGRIGDGGIWARAKILLKYKSGRADVSFHLTEDIIRDCPTRIAEVTYDVTLNYGQDITWAHPRPTAMQHTLTIIPWTALKMSGNVLTASCQQFLCRINRLVSLDQHVLTCRLSEASNLFISYFFGHTRPLRLAQSLAVRYILDDNFIIH